MVVVLSSKCIKQLVGQYPLYVFKAVILLMTMKLETKVTSSSSDMQILLSKWSCW